MRAINTPVMLTPKGGIKSQASSSRSRALNVGNSATVPKPNHVFMIIAVTVLVMVLLEGE